MTLRTSGSMVLDAHAALEMADELVEAAAVLLAEAVLSAFDDVQSHVMNYRRAKAQQVYATAVYEAVSQDHAAVSA